MAIDRYVTEVRRISSVLNSVLKDREYLVGDKCTYADLAFVSYQTVILMIIDYDQSKEYPYLQAWIDRMVARPVTGAFLKERDEEFAAIVKANGGLRMKKDH